MNIFNRIFGLSKIQLEFKFYKILLFLYKKYQTKIYDLYRISRNHDIGFDTLEYLLLKIGVSKKDFRKRVKYFLNYPKPTYLTSPDINIKSLNKNVIASKFTEWNLPISVSQMSPTDKENLIVNLRTAIYNAEIKEHQKRNEYLKKQNEKILTEKEIEKIITKDLQKIIEIGREK